MNHAKKLEELGSIRGKANFITHSVESLDARSWPPDMAITRLGEQISLLAQQVGRLASFLYQEEEAEA